MLFNLSLGCCCWLWLAHLSPVVSQCMFAFTFDFSPSCIGEGNGNPLLCSCLENPRDGGAWRATIYGVAQSQTQLKRLSSSSSRGEKGMNRQRTGAISGSETTSCAAVMVNTCPYRFVQTHRIYNKSEPCGETMDFGNNVSTQVHQL